MHFGTTSMPVEEEYDGEHTIPDNYGCSKDKRPKLKQIVFGIGSNHGVHFSI